MPQTSPPAGRPRRIAAPRYRSRSPARLRLPAHESVPAATIGCGACTFLNPLASYYEPNVAGAAAHAFAVPCATAVYGFQMEVQWVSLLTPSSPCPLVAGLSASNRVRFAVGQ